MSGRPTHVESDTSTHYPSPRAGLVRGSLRLGVSASSPQVTAGTDFSIFVLIQNPFDVPITVYNVQTHIPVELIDMNALRLEIVQRRKAREQNSWTRRWTAALADYLFHAQRHSGIATAVSTSFNPDADREFVRVQTTIDQMGDHASVVGVQFAFPQNPTSEDLDRIFRRLDDYRKGLIPVTLQPGDSVVRQFVLRTRHWLLFSPLTHSFQIQVDYASDGVDHADTVAHQQSIRSTLGAMAAGAFFGALLGTTLKGLSTSPSGTQSGGLLRAGAASVLASIAMVVAFARKTAAQPVVSVEDFWGGVLIGFTTGFFGFEQFFGMLSPNSTS